MTSKSTLARVVAKLPHLSVEGEHVLRPIVEDCITARLRGDPLPDAQALGMTQLEAQVVHDEVIDGCLDCEISLMEMSAPCRNSHGSMCCDCFDEQHGMPASSRANPRPTKDEPKQ